MAEMWTVKRCLDWTRDYLKDKGEERPRVSAEWMLSSATGLSRMELYLNFTRPLAPEELAVMHEYVVRRVKGEPLQYITGDTQFRTLTIACEAGVLIPRPETEVLVEEVLSFLDAEVLGGGVERRRAELPWNAEVDAALKAEQAAVGIAADASEAAGAESDAPVEDPATAPEPEAPARLARVLEIGCGTGCISLSLAAERPGQVRCVATDIDPHAVALSLRNREALGIDPALADFREGDLATPVAMEERGTFDVLVSNPPYIPIDVMSKLPAEVARWEPRHALESGVDGLDMFRRILAAAPHMLRPGGLLACELHEEALDAAKGLCLAAGLEDARIIPDLAGRPRIILALLP